MKTQAEGGGGLGDGGEGLSGGGDGDGGEGGAGEGEGGAGEGEGGEGEGAGGEDGAGEYGAGSRQHASLQLAESFFFHNPLFLHNLVHLLGFFLPHKYFKIKFSLSLLAHLLEISSASQFFGSSSATVWGRL